MTDPTNRRVLSDADLHALKDLLHAERMCALENCTFDEESRVALRKLAEVDPNVLVKLADAYQDATGYIWKGILGLALVALVALALLGVSLKGKLGL